MGLLDVDPLKVHCVSCCWGGQTNAPLMYCAGVPLVHADGHDDDDMVKVDVPFMVCVDFRRWRPTPPPPAEHTRVCRCTCRNDER